MQHSTDAYTTWELLDEGEKAAAFIISKADGATWDRWKMIGRAINFVHSVTTNKRQQGILIKQYPNLSRIPSVSRSDAKWIWEHRDRLEDLSAKTGLRLGHPSVTRQEYRIATGQSPTKDRHQLRSGIRDDVEEFLRRNHNNRERVIDVIMALAGACGDRRVREILSSIQQS